jgi:tetratricopeptide (TPR) repeat protein
MLYVFLSTIIYTSALLAIISMIAASLGYFSFKKLQAGVTDELYYARALFLHDRKCFSAAIADYSRTLELNPDHQHAARNRDRAFARQQPFGQEQEDIPAPVNEEEDVLQEIAPVASPEQAATTFLPSDSINQGIMYAKQGRLDESVAEFNLAITQNPQSATAYMNRGIVHARANNQNLALEDFDKAIELNPEMAESYLNKGILHAKAADFDKAIENFIQAINLKPDYAVAYKKRGEAYIRTNLFNNGIEDFTQAIRINPRYAEAYISRGRAFAQRGKYKEAQEDYWTAVTFKPDIAHTYYQRGRHHKKNGEQLQALENLKIACDLGVQAACLEYKNIRSRSTR